MTYKNSTLLERKVLPFVLLMALLVSVQSQCCLQFGGSKCIRCPAGMHLYRSNCIYDIDGCLEYTLGFDCATCRSGYQMIEGECKRGSNETVSETCNEFFIDLSNLQNNPIYSVGYAVIAQQYNLASLTVTQLFYINASQVIYGLYLSKQSVYYRFAFTINDTVGEFEIVNYTQSYRPLVDQTTTNTNTTTKITPKTKSNATTVMENVTVTPQVKTVKINNSTISTEKSNFASNSSASTHCGKATTEFIDITNKQNNDIFLPRLNLLLHVMYETLLVNTHISSAKYILGLDPSTSNNITYQIVYENLEGRSFAFEVAIINNEFQLIKSPNSNSTDSSIANSTIHSDVEAESKSDNQSSQVNTSNFKPEVTGSNSSSSEISKGQQQIKVNNHSSAVVENKTNSTFDNKTEEIVISINKVIPKPTNSTDVPTKTTTNTSSDTKVKAKANETSNSTSQVIEIPMKNYTTEPKYKSLITILRSLYRVPMNATVISMQTWGESAGNSKYVIAFRMNYQSPLPDESVAKVSTYTLAVNPSSFVSVQSEKITYVKPSPSQLPPTPTPIPPSQPTSSAPTPSPIPPMNQNADNRPSLPMPLPTPLAQSDSVKPPYLKALFDIFTFHSPKLSGYQIQSIKSSPGEKNYGGSVAPFKQKLQFSNQKEILCFEVSYELITLDNNSQIQGKMLNLIDYIVANCSETQQNPKQSYFIGGVMSFSNESSVNPTVNQQLLAMNNNNPFKLDINQRYLTFYRVRLSSLGFGEREVVIDSLTSVVISYRTSPLILYTDGSKNASFFDISVVNTFRTQMEKIFKLIPGSISLSLIQKMNDNNDIWLIEVYGMTQVQSKWAQSIHQRLKIQATYLPKQSFIKIVSASPLGLVYHSYSLNLTDSLAWIKLEVEETFTQTYVNSLMNSLKAEYSSFLDNSLLLSIFRQSSSNSSFNKNLSSPLGARFLIAISKQFSSSYESSYLLTVRYSKSSNRSQIENLQLLSTSNLQISNCQSYNVENSSNFPVCKRCKSGYRLQQSFCSPIINECEQYSLSACVQCQSGSIMSKDMQNCESIEGEKEKISRGIENFMTMPKN